LLDNFYCDGEVSADGHNWSMGAYGTDFWKKHGQQIMEVAVVITQVKVKEKQPTIKWFIWDQCSKKGISYRTYGEFTDE
jgi:hypothetical protein